MSIRGGGTDKVCHLRRDIYGLKQSPRAWFAKFSQLVLAFGLTACTMDPTVFRKHTSAGSIILAIYVDDILVTGSDTTGISQVKSHLQKHLNIRDLGTPKYFLGIEFAYKHGKLILNQCKYVLDILEETGLLGCKPQSSPIDSKPQFWDITSPPLTDANIYRRLLGKLIYLTITRPDITYTVGLLSQFMHSPQEIHWHAALRVLAYLKHAPGRGLLYQHHGHLRIEGYSDSSYAGDRGDRKSTFGFCILVGGNLVTWRSQKQRVVSLSSAEAEYRSMTHTSSEMLWVRSLLQELGFPVQEAMPMYCDNQAAIFISNNPTFHERTKHIEIDCHAIRDRVLAGLISTPHVGTTNQLADIFTKGLSTTSYDVISRKLGLFDIYAPA